MLTQEERNEIASDLSEDAASIFNRLTDELDVYRISTQIKGAIELRAMERIYRIRNANK